MQISLIVRTLGARVPGGYKQKHRADMSPLILRTISAITLSETEYGDRSYPWRQNANIKQQYYRLDRIFASGKFPFGFSRLISTFHLLWYFNSLLCNAIGTS